MSVTCTLPARSWCTTTCRASTASVGPKFSCRRPLGPSPRPSSEGWSCCLLWHEGLAKALSVAHLSAAHSTRSKEARRCPGSCNARTLTAAPSEPAAPYHALARPARVPQTLPCVGSKRGRQLVQVLVSEQHREQPQAEGTPTDPFMPRLWLSSTPRPSTGAESGVGLSD